MQNYVEYYAEIVKPFFAPPGWVFGLAWGVIYPLIAIAFVYLLYLAYKKRAPLGLIALFVLNMVGNLLFTPILFGAQNIALATADIYLVLATLALFEYRVYRYSKFIFWLLVPYLLWGTFATILQTSILSLN